MPPEALDDGERRNDDGGAEEHDTRETGGVCDRIRRFTDAVDGNDVQQRRSHDATADDPSVAAHENSRSRGFAVDALPNSSSAAFCAFVSFAGTVTRSRASRSPRPSP